ncbi:isochorismate synthase [Herbidospora yilanensis]|uniref:isochorismate synthase n=1 Tax=Herbidospora yilanensis TaxID=354426 RepID=UPI00078385B6|nr:chorismate-binding protein [Herbidospora yilanensis]
MELVRTVPIQDPGPLIAAAPFADSLLWLHGDEGMAGWGIAARFEVSGPGRFEHARRWFRRWLAQRNVDDRVGLPGSGPVAFGSFTFDHGPGRSVFVIPQVLIARRGGASWMTTVGDPCHPDGTVPDPLPNVRWLAEPDAEERWHKQVSRAVDDIRSGRLHKVVLARDVRGLLGGPFDPRMAVSRLHDRFPGCWTFAVDGLVGASPELLTGRFGRMVKSLVLAGTDWPGGAIGLGTEKTAVEHELAADSAEDVLRAHCSELDVHEPHELQLANVTHLATRISGTLRHNVDALTLASRLHPTAAVCGTPFREALALLRELENLDRGRYAGPVGWQDARGDGEWCIALRCAEVTGPNLRLFAGCGIVGDSNPTSEWHETEAKLGAIRDLFAEPTCVK